MVIEYHEGDLFTSTAPALAHGVNCQGVMGAGIAKEFARRYPDMVEVYRVACRGGDPEGFPWWRRMSLVPGRLLPYPAGDRWIYNLATQDRPGRNARIEWVESCFAGMIHYMVLEGVDRVAMPRIGCGIGGLDWGDVLAVLEKTTPEAITVEVWTLP